MLPPLNVLIAEDEFGCARLLQILMRRKVVDALVTKDERLAEHVGPPVHWLPEIYKVFDATAGKSERREFEKRFGKEPAPFVEKALHQASWVLPRIVASCYPYGAFPMTRGWAEKQRLGDLPAGRSVADFQLDKLGWRP